MHRRYGVSLIEVLVVLGVLLVLAGILLPALESSREAARSMQCRANLRNWGVALNNYLSVHRHLPPAATWHVGPANLRHKDIGRHSLFGFLLPYVEQTELFQKLDWRQDWNSKTNEPMAKQPLDGITVCPSAPGGRRDKHVSDYTTALRIDPTERNGIGQLLRNEMVRPRRGLPRERGQWGDGHRAWEGLLVLEDVSQPRRLRRKVRAKDVVDGHSKTIALIEDAGKPFCFRHRVRAKCHITRFRWASPTIWMTINDVCRAQQLVNCHNNSQPYAFHNKHLHAVNSDGSLRIIASSIDADVFVSHITREGND